MQLNNLVKCFSLLYNILYNILTVFVLQSGIVAYSLMPSLGCLEAICRKLRLASLMKQAQALITHSSKYFNNKF